MAEGDNSKNVDGLNENLEKAATVPGASQSRSVCPEHGEQQILFCTICVKGVCCRCIVDDHNGHPLDYYHDATARGVAVRNALSWEIEDAINELTIGKRRVIRVQRSVDQKMGTAKREIKNFMKKCHKALDKREQDLLGQLNAAHTEKNTLLEQQNEQITEHIQSLVTSYYKLHNGFSMEDPELQAAINSQALVELTASRQVNLIPASNDRINFWGDLAVKLRLRRHLGTLEVGGDVIPKQEDDNGYNSPEESE